MTADDAPAFNLTETDRQVLAQTDEEFIYHDWDDLKSIIGMFRPTHPPDPLHAAQNTAQPNQFSNVQSIPLLTHSPPGSFRTPPSPN